MRIQGFPDSFKIVVPYGKIKKQTGNSVAVPVIEAVAREMIKALKEFSKTEEKTDGKSTEIEGFKAFNDTDFVPVECVS